MQTGGRNPGWCSARRVESCGSRCAVAAGFTLVEVIVVIVMLAIFGGLIVPRIIGSGVRQAEAESRQAQRLLTIMAERQAISPEPQALEYDERDRQLRLLVMRAAAGTTPDEPAVWRPDPGVPPLTFSQTHLAQALADGRALPRSKWRLVVAGGDQPRPSIALVIRAGASSGGGAAAAADSPSWVVALGPEASAATWGSEKSQSAGSVGLAQTLDLDAMGKGDKPW